jgi:competence protein ComEC
LIALCLGASRYQSAIPDLTNPAFIANYNDSDVSWEVTGLIDAPPDVRDTYINLRIQAESLNPYRTDAEPRAVTGLILARVDHGTEFRYGDRLTLRGYLETPPENEDFSYRDYLTRQGVYSLMRGYNATVLASGQGNPFFQTIFSLKTRAFEQVYRLWPDPEASLFAGILLGVETGIPATVQQAFKDTGTSHVIAISGFNITIIAGLFASFFGRFLGPRKGALAAVIGISIYTILVGADAAVLRAAIMGGLALFA